MVPSGLGSTVADGSMHPLSRRATASSPAATTDFMLRSSARPPSDTTTVAEPRQCRGVSGASASRQIRALIAAEKCGKDENGAGERLAIPRMAANLRSTFNGATVVRRGRVKAEAGAAP